MRSSYFENQLTVSRWLEQWLRNYKKDAVQSSTYRNYVSILRPIQVEFFEIPLAEWDEVDIQIYMDDLIAMGLYSTAHHLKGILVQALSQAMNNGLIDYNPAQKIKLPKEKSSRSVALTIEMQQLFLRALEDERLKNFFQFQLRTGLRPGEMGALQWGNIDWEHRKLSVRGNVQRVQAGDGGSKLAISPTKTGRVREIELTNFIFKILYEHLEMIANEIDAGRYLDTKLIFPTRRGTLLEVCSINRTLKRIRGKMQILRAEELKIPIDEVDIPKFTAHTLRHTFATRAIESGISQKGVAELLGHSTTRVTGNTYCHILPEAQHADVCKLEQYLKVVSVL